MNSKILLVKNINIDKQYTNVLSYTEAQMLELCQANLVAQADNYSFLRPTGSIMAGFTYAQCLQANYIAFQNPDYSNKWFFAWIDDVIYKGDRNTEITFTIDAWSTWFDKWQKKVCFINRQHVNDDAIGKNTIAENLDIGEVIEEGEEEKITGLGEEFYYVVMTTYDPIFDDFVGVNKVNGNLFGCKLFAFSSSNVGITWLSNFLKAVNNKSKIDSIQGIFIAPLDLINNIGTTQREGFIGPGQLGQYIFYEIDNSSDVLSLPYNFRRVTSYSDFQPRNNKCFVYPYNYLYVTNNVGSKNILKYEDFILNGEINQNPIVELEIALTVGCSGRLVPRGYKNISYNYDESIPLGKYPTCAWASDAFTNWLTNNAVNIATNVGLGLAGVTIGIATGGVGLAVAGLSVAGTVGNLIGQFNKADLLPSIESGNNTGDVNFSALANTFVLHHMRVKTEYLKIIDDYFTRFRLFDKISRNA